MSDNGTQPGKDANDMMNFHLELGQANRANLTFTAVLVIVTLTLFFFFFLNLADGHLLQRKRHPRKPALCHLWGCLKSVALCQWPQSWATEQPLGEVQGPSVTHVLLTGGPQKLFQLSLLEKQKKKDGGWALRAWRERWVSHLQPLPFPGLTRPGSKWQCKASKGNKESIPTLWEVTVGKYPSKAGAESSRIFSYKKRTFESVFALQRYKPNKICFFLFSLFLEELKNLAR